MVTKSKSLSNEEMINNEELIPDLIGLEEIPGLGPKFSKILLDAGITSPDQIMKTNLTELEIIGFNRNISKKIRENIKSMFPEIYYDFTEEQSLEDIEGIGPTTAKNLREKGMNIQLLSTTPIKELEEKYGLTENSAAKYQNLINIMSGNLFQNALELMEQEKNMQGFTLGANSLDQLFQIPEISSSGIRQGETYELFGSFRTGKSQLCHQLCITVQLPVELGGLAKKAIYIDTEGTLSPSRLYQMANRIKGEKNWDKDVKEILSDIIYSRAKNSDMQDNIVQKLLEIIGESPNDYGLLVVDSVTAHFRAEYAGRGTLADRQQTLNHHLSLLHRIADTYNLAVIVTNQVQSNPAQFFGDPTQPAGGNIMAHWAKTRCYLRKSKGEKRVIRIYDSPSLPEQEAIFEITEDGIISPKDE